MSDTVDDIPSDYFTAGIDPVTFVWVAPVGASIVVNWPSLSTNPWTTLPALIYAPTISPPLIPRIPVVVAPGVPQMELGEPDKGEDLDLEGFSVRLWGNDLRPTSSP